MKSTGIVRRIDDLGRVVIPKEIRRTMRFNVDSEIEIFTNGDQIILQRYSAIESMSAIFKDILDAIYRTHKMPLIACDKEKVVAAKGICKEEIINRRLTVELKKIMEQRTVYAHDADSGSFCFPVEGIERYMLACAPVIASGDSVGAILCLSGDNSPVSSATETQVGLIQTFAAYLGKQLSD